jgi:hypothetical protein
VSPPPRPVPPLAALATRPAAATPPFGRARTIARRWRGRQGRRELGEVGPGTRPSGFANRQGRRRWWGARSRADQASGGGYRLRRRLGGQAERREEPPHGVGFGHRAEDPPRASAARTDQDLDREHAAEESAPGPSPGGSPAGVRARAVRRRRDDRRSPAGTRGEDAMVGEQRPARRGDATFIMPLLRYQSCASTGGLGRTSS